jgi:ankyrin repeat protein
MVKVLLEKGACVDPHPGFTSPLHGALSHWRDIKQESDGEETVKLLLEAGADPNATCPREGAPQLRHTPLMRAMANASITVVELLLDHGANFNPEIEQKWSPLNSAANKSSAEMVKLLLDRGCNPNDRDDYMKTPIFWAVLCGDREKVEALLSHGADINSPDYYLETPLMLAAQQGILSMVDYLLQRGSKVSAEDIAGNTALFHAAGAGYKEVAGLLLEKGANLHHRNALMETPLFWAARNGHAAVTDLLLARGAEADPCNMFLETPLLHAASEADASNEERYTPIVHLLVERGANVDPTYRDPDTLEVYELLEVVSRLKPDFGSELNSESERIIRSYWKNQTQSMDGPQLLAFAYRLTYPTDPSQRRNWQIGMATPLLWAVVRGCKRLASIFLGLGARLD